MKPTPTHILLLNDMRSAHFENQAIAAHGTFDELLDLLAKESVPSYKDGKWSKGFLAGGPLEWCNKPYCLAELLTCPADPRWREWIQKLPENVLGVPGYTEGYIAALKDAGYGRVR